MKLIIVFLFIGFSMVLTELMTPKKIKLMNKEVILETKIPKSFASWKSIDTHKLVMVNPDEGSLTSKLYSQVLERTYLNEEGAVVLLSIAYGAEQRNDLLAHFPEVCYPAQGFNVDSSEVQQISLIGKDIFVKQLKTQRGDRFEDVTYFIRVGNKIVSTRADQKWESIKYGVKGIIPDGLIFRVSTIGTMGGFSLHEKFINDFFNSVDSETKIFLTADFFLLKGN